MGKFQYALDESGKRLEIRKANGQDEGVYMCETEVLVQNHDPIKTLQYVILQGEEHPANYCRVSVRAHGRHMHTVHVRPCRHGS